MIPYDSTSEGFTPWWTRCTEEEFDIQLRRLRRALRFCRGRAADLKPHLQAHIDFLEIYRLTKY